MPVPRRLHQLLADRSPRRASSRPAGRERRKKCDETHSNEHGGACQRCIQGAWKCQWPIPSTQQPVRVFERGARTKAREGRSTSRSASVDAVAPPLPEAAVPNSSTAVPAFTATPAALAPTQAGPAVTQFDGLAPSSSQNCPPASRPSSPQRSSLAHLDSIRPGFHSLGSLGRIAEHANLEVTFQAVDQELCAWSHDPAHFPPFLPALDADTPTRTPVQASQAVSTPVEPLEELDAACEQHCNHAPRTQT